MNYDRLDNMAEASTSTQYSQNQDSGNGTYYESTPVSTVKKRRKQYKSSSPVWLHAKKIMMENKQVIKCNYCTVFYVWLGSTTNMLDNLKDKHCLGLLENGKNNEEVSSSDESALNSKRFKENDERMSKIDKDLLKFIISASFPFRVVENCYFQRFVSKLNKNYRVPNRVKISKELLEKEYGFTLKIIRDELSKTEAVGLTIDLWTSI
ncbi:unnamed protein product [Brachionus calyciflorus]|uniref:BED-type domain-containing protein n=1 Tax=Brachionus calyciflorus TaxID=104777 RepID=A0A814BT65_9BILA|nr:unnamed protein product [Brachionus calyciflorus]